MSYYSCISDVSSLEFAHFDWQTNWENYFFALHLITLIINSGHYLIVTNIVLHVLRIVSSSDAQNYIPYGLHNTIRNTFHMRLQCHKTFLFPIGLPMIFSSQIGYHWGKTRHFKCTCNLLLSGRLGFPIISAFLFY